MRIAGFILTGDVAVAVVALLIALMLRVLTMAMIKRRAHDLWLRLGSPSLVAAARGPDRRTTSGFFSHPETIVDDPLLRFLARQYVVAVHVVAVSFAIGAVLGAILLIVNHGRPLDLRPGQ